MVMVGEFEGAVREEVGELESRGFGHLQIEGDGGGAEEIPQQKREEISRRELSTPCQ